METPARISDRDTSHDLVVIGVRVLDDAYMNWVATEVESEHALRTWSTRLRRILGRRTWHTMERSTARKQRPATYSDFAS
jgi:hypothetical protein